MIRVNRSSPWAWGGVVFVFAIILRLGLWLSYQPVHYSDTPAYRRLAQSILDGWRTYDGTRTPGYPLLLAIGGSDEQIWRLQMGLGLGITISLFIMAWLVSRQAWFAGLVALAHSLNLGQLFFEANLITETLATFWVTLTLTGLFLWLVRPQVRSFALIIALAITASMAWLTRPLFVFLPFWMLPFLGVTWSAPARRIAWAKAGVFLTIGAIFLGTWTNFIHDRFNMWGLSVMTGYHLIQHTGNFFELVPDEHAPLRDTYLRYREIQIATRGSQVNTIWDAIPELQKVSGLNFYRLSRHLSRISLELILEHPDRYLQNVIKGWWLFWRAPVYWSPEAVKQESLVSILQLAVSAERFVLIGCNLLFVVSSLLALVWRRMRTWWRISPPLWCLAGTVWIASIIQTLLDHGDNPRFLIPLQSMVVFWVLWISVESVKQLRWRAQGPGGSPKA